VSDITVKSARRTLQRLQSLAAQIAPQNLAAALPAFDYQALADYLADTDELADDVEPRHCAKCGTPLSRHTRIDQQYCTHACRQAVYRQRHVTPSRQSIGGDS
jgi:predicted nucleic acid-binding Zn ribbon protein